MAATWVSKIGTGIWGGAGAAAVLRQPYERLECEAVESDASRLNLGGLNELADFRVDIVALQKMVEDGLRVIESTQRRDAIQI